MTPSKDWLEETNLKIDSYKKSFTKAESRKYRLDFLKRVAKRVDEFSSACGVCYQSKGEITTLLNNLDGLIQLSPMATKNFREKIKFITGHLRQKHKLIPAGTYTAIANGIGAALGAALGVITDNIGSGIAVGVSAGVALGVALEAKAKKDGRIL